MNIQPQTNKRLHQLLNQTGLLSRKADLINGFTKGRSSSSKEMTNLEGLEMIHYLEQQPNKSGEADKRANQMRRKIFAMCHKMGWVDSKGKVKIETLDRWCVEKGYLNKELHLYSVSELPKLVSQFTKVYEYFLNS